jgi:hypothetical protein
MRTFLCVAAVSASLGSRVLAEDHPAKECLEQCKAQAEQCAESAGGDPDRVQQCTSEALACVQSCES